MLNAYINIAVRLPPTLRTIRIGIVGLSDVAFAQFGHARDRSSIEHVVLDGDAQRFPQLQSIVVELPDSLSQSKGCDEIEACEEMLG